jgi:dTDP-4-amino-4,6-dideoxygalactose transaminase
MPLSVQELAEKSMFTLNDLNTHRRHVAHIYEKALDADFVIPVPKRSLPVYTRFPVMAGPGSIPKDLKRLGVRRMYPKAIADEETIKPYVANQPVSTPGAAHIAQTLSTLPTHMGITKDLAKQIAQKVRTFLGHG